MQEKVPLYLQALNIERYNMGRVTEFVNYIHERYEPTPLDKISVYSHVVFVEKVQQAAKKYRKIHKVKL